VLCDQLAEEKAKRLRLEKKQSRENEGAAESLVDDVFSALKGKKADEIILLHSLKLKASSSSLLGPSSSSMTSPGGGGRHRPRSTSKRRLSRRKGLRLEGAAAEEFPGAGVDDATALAAMMLKLGVGSKDSRWIDGWIDGEVVS
jgi:hypothetical protein